MQSKYYTHHTEIMGTGIHNWCAMAIMVVLRQTLALAGLFSRIPMERFFVMAAATALMLFIVGGCGKKEDPAPKAVTRPVKVITVAGGTDAGSFSLPAKTRASQRAHLSFKVSGPLVELPVEEGQEVKKGALIGRIDSRDFDADLRNAQGRLAKAKAALKLARSEYDRVQRIQKQDPGAMSASMVDQNREAVDRARAEIKSLQADVDLSKLQLSYTYLKAPFAGIVAKRYVENHQEVLAKQPIVFLQDISAIEILVDVPETLMALIRDGEEPDAIAKFAVAPDRTFPLRLKEFSTKADPQTQTYQVVLEMPRPQGINILPGMTATVEGDPESLTGNRYRIVIPAIAVTQDSEKKPYVWVLDEAEMTVKKTVVRVGELTGSDGIVILDGLSGGEKVVTAGVTKLQAGMKVSIWDASN